MYLTLGQAAREAKVSKPYLSKLIKTGKISATREVNGEYRIDPCELDRLASIRKQRQQGNRAGERVNHAPVNTWEAERTALLQLLSDREQSIADLRADRDAWRALAERNEQRLLLAEAERRGGVTRLWRWLWDKSSGA
jgi:excisionase family DNA binding protein